MSAKIIAALVAAALAAATLYGALNYGEADTKLSPAIDAAMQK